VLARVRDTVHSFLYRIGDHPALLSFPTRRSSDLSQRVHGPEVEHVAHRPRHRRPPVDDLEVEDGQEVAHRLLLEPGGVDDADGRSEEHTSELQSRFDLVCRLLLEKKKNKYTH